MLQDFGNIGLLLAVALVFPLMALVTAFFIRPKNPGVE